MSSLQRWLRFNAVGLAGMAIQLATLSALAHGLHLIVPLASAIAVELAILCNFALHRRFTWPAHRASPRSRGSQLLRFHLSNGLVSLVGNTLLTPWLAHRGLPLLVANLAAIASCSAANFALAASWVFAQPRQPHPDASAVR